MKPLSAFVYPWQSLHLMTDETVCTNKKGRPVKYILLVDDNEDNTDILATLLSSCLKGVSFRRAENGKEAVEILQTQPVDLILTDIKMPVMDGYQLIEYRNSHHPRLPLVVMTADASREVIRKLNILGITDCLEKPFSYETLARMFLKKLSAGIPEPVPQTGVAHCR